MSKKHPCWDDIYLKGLAAGFSDQWARYVADAWLRFQRQQPVGRRGGKYAGA